MSNKTPKTYEEQLEILKKMEKYFTAAQIKEKKDAFYKALSSLK